MHAFSPSSIHINSLSFTINSEISSQKTQEKIQELESELNKSNLLLKKKQLEINHLQKILNTHRETSNNTSNSFLLSSEFKKEWTTLGTTVIMESFEHVFNRSHLLSIMVQETFLITFTETKKLIKDKVNHIMTYFNIASEYETFENKVKPFFEEYFTAIFFGNKNENESLVNSILATLTNNIINKSICQYYHKEILQDIQSENIKNFINKSIKLCLYMHLHSPVLSIKISPFDSREPTYCYFNHNEHVSIEGFEKEKSPCVVILPSPLLSSGFAFLGIKPFVYIIEEPDEEIFEKCEISKKESLLSRRIHSKSYGGEENKKKKEESIPIEDKECSIESKKMNLSDRSPEKKDTLFQLSSSSSSEEDKSHKYSDSKNTAKTENVNKLTKKGNEQILPFTGNINSRNKIITPSLPITIQKDNSLMNKTTCVNYSSNANISMCSFQKTQSKQVNRISQILFNISNHTTMNTPQSSSSSSKPKKDKRNLPPHFTKTPSNGILNTNKTQLVSRRKSHPQSSSVNRGNTLLMNCNLSLNEKEGQTSAYICKTLAQANGVLVKSMMMNVSVSKDNRSEKPRKKKLIHVISNNPLSTRVKRHNRECCLRNNINNKKDKNNISNTNTSSVKFNNNDMNGQGVINRKIVKRTNFTNDLLSFYNNRLIFTHSGLNGTK